MNTREIDDFLARNEYLNGLSSGARRALAEICLVKTYGKREILFHEGQAGFGFFILERGSVRVTRTTPDGREMTVKVLRPGEVFGEVVLFEKKEYPARAEAMEPSAAIIIPRKQIFCLLEDEGFRRSFLALLMGKLRYLTDRMLYLTAHDVEERFFMFLEEHYGQSEEYRIAMAKKDFASAIGTNPETLSRLVARLEREGIISWRGRILRRL